MTDLRLDDRPGSAGFDRTDRLFCDSSNGLWYFRTREGRDIGPFRYRNEAEAMLQRFVDEIRASSKQAIAGTKLHFRMSAQRSL